MKNLVMTLLVVVATTTLTTKASAINPTNLGSNITLNKPVNFVEVRETNAARNTTLLWMEPLTQQTTSMGERKMRVEIDDNEPTTTATAEVNVYSLDGTDVLGPYTVTEGTVLEVDIDECEWSVSTLSTSQGAEISYWIVE